MSTNINHHVFHQFLSNGYKIKNSYPKYDLINNKPIHIKKSIFGSQDPFLSEEERENVENKPIAFENEKEAFLWYKKRKNLQTKYNKLISYNEEKEDIFCKNYFTIPEEEFYKYKGYFNGMIKSLVVDLNCNINYQGSCSEINDCVDPCSSSSSSSSVPEPSSANINLSQSTLLNILESLDFDFLQNEIISSQQNFNESNAPCCRCPPCGADPGYKCSTNLNLNTNLYINFDSSKIFEINELEKRLNGISIDREFSPYYGDYREDSNSDEGNFYQGPIDELSSFKIGKIFYKDWLLNKNNENIENDWDYFFKNPENSNKFSNNSTIINDPVTYDGDFNNSILSPRWRIVVDPETNGLKSDGSSYNIEEKISLQSTEKSSNNLGNYILNISSNNMILRQFTFILDIELTDILYIKSEKKYICFIELEIRTDDKVNSYIERYPQDYSIINSFDFNFLTLYSTEDSRKLFDKDHISCPNSNTGGVKLVKTKIPIYIEENLIEIEVLTPELKEIEYFKTKESVGTNFCPGNDLLNQSCINLSFKKSWSLLNNKPFIKIESWSKTDFSKENIFPIKKL